MPLVVSIIIPCFNESNRILSTVNILKKWSNQSQIIVVDDGSDLVTKSILKKIDHITLITNPKNIGKSLSLYNGLLSAKGDIIVFIDADLKFLQPQNITDLVKPIQDEQINMVVADYNSSLPKPFRILHSGQRAFRKKQLIKYMESFKEFKGCMNGYLLEPYLNKIFFRQKTAFIKFTNVFHFDERKKSGLIKGQMKYLKNFINSLCFFGPKEYLYQLFYILSHS